MSQKFQFKNLVSLVIIGTSLALSACDGAGGGSGGGGTNPSPTPGGQGIHTVATIDNKLDTKYTASCIYRYADEVVLINGDNSGSGFGLDINSGNVVPKTGLPKIDIANGDQCLPSSYQVVWINKNSPQLVLHFYDPYKNTEPKTTQVDLSNVPQLSLQAILGSSFNWNSADDILISNGNFSGADKFAFSKFNLSDSPLTSFTTLNNLSYLRSFEARQRVLYGFWGMNEVTTQFLPPEGNQPTLLVRATYAGAPLQQEVDTITDTNNQPIAAMNAAWDVANGGVGGLLIATGLLQPTIYDCGLSHTNLHNFSCDRTYTSDDLLAKYKIMKILGGTNNTIYFFGLNLVNQNVGIFAMAIN